jgi:hypothetical protein
MHQLLVRLLKIIVDINEIPYGHAQKMFEWLHNWGFVATLALGLWPRQGFAKVRAKWEGRESHLLLSGVW